MIEMEFELLKSSLDKIGAWTDSVVDVSRQSQSQVMCVCTKDES